MAALSARSESPSGLRADKRPGVNAKMKKEILASESGRNILVKLGMALPIHSFGGSDLSSATRSCRGRMRV